MNVILEVTLWLLRFAAGAGIYYFFHAAVCRIPGKRYLIIECMGGIAFVFCCAFYGCGEYGIISLRGFLAFIYLGILAAVAWNDWNARVICDRFHIAIFVLGIVAIWLFPEQMPAERLAGALIISLPMLAMAVSLNGAFGGGDIKLMAASGFLLGWRAVVAAASLGILAAGIYCVLMLAGKKLSRKDRFAFGPFLSIGLAAAFFYGDRILNWYLAV